MCAHLFLLEQEAHLFEPFIEAGAALVHGDSEAGEFMRQERARKTDLQAPAGDRVRHPDLTGQLERMVEHRQHGPGDEPDRMRHRRGRAEKYQRVRAVAAVGVKIMLDRAHIGEAQLLGEAGKLQRLAPILIGRLLRGPDRRERTARRIPSIRPVARPRFKPDYSASR